MLLSEEEVSALSREYGICAETLYRPISHWTKDSGLNAEVESSQSNEIKNANRKIEGTAAELNIAKDSSDLFNPEARIRSKRITMLRPDFAIWDARREKLDVLSG